MSEWVVAAAADDDDHYFQETCLFVDWLLWLIFVVKCKHFLFISTYTSHISTMEWLFGRKKSPEELLRQNQRVLNKAIRELDRERTKMEGQVRLLYFSLEV